MDFLEKTFSSEICSYHSIAKEGYDYSGQLRFNDKIGLFFYRKRNRFDELIAGYGEHYHIGMEDHILIDIEKREVEYIIIETQYNTWEIYLYEFLDKMIYSSIDHVYVCGCEYFLKESHNKSLIEIKKRMEKEYGHTGQQIGLML